MGFNNEIKLVSLLVADSFFMGQEGKDPPLLN